MIIPAFSRNSPTIFAYLFFNFFENIVVSHPSTSQVWSNWITDTVSWGLPTMEIYTHTHTVYCRVMFFPKATAGYGSTFFKKYFLSSHVLSRIRHWSLYAYFYFFEIRSYLGKTEFWYIPPHWDFFLPDVNSKLVDAHDN